MNICKNDQCEHEYTIYEYEYGYGLEGIVDITIGNNKCIKCNKTQTVKRTYSKNTNKLIREEKGRFW